MHCRRCNYNLSATAHDQPCPECGPDRRRRSRIIGRTRRRRLAVPLAIGLAAALSYGTLHALRVGRINRASQLFTINSTRLAVWADGRKLPWAKPYIKTVYTLIEINPASGRVRRTLQRRDTPPHLRPSISPDSRVCVTTLENGELAAIDLRSGQVKHTVALLDGGVGPSKGDPRPGWSHVAGWLDDHSVCVQFFNPAVLPIGKTSLIGGM